MENKRSHIIKVYSRSRLMALRSQRERMVIVKVNIYLVPVVFVLRTFVSHNSPLKLPSQLSAQDSAAYVPTLIIVQLISNHFFPGVIRHT